MALLDLLGRRGSLRLLWELRGGVRLTFRGLQDASELSPSVLNIRLSELRAAGVVDHGADGYGLTPTGVALLAHLAPLQRWADAWARRDVSNRRRVRRSAPAGEDRA
jgi:DNA-binding HxlR family transcriptional regulator